MDTYIIVISSTVREDRNPLRKRVETSQLASVRLYMLLVLLFYFIFLLHKEVFIRY